MHVLLVEDERAAREAMERWLVRRGHTVCWSSTARGAIRLLVTEPVDVMLLDMVLDDGPTGWDVLWYRYGDPELKELHVIIISGLPSEEIHSRARTNVLEGTKTQMMGKPINLDDLEERLTGIDEVIKSTPNP